MTPFTHPIFWRDAALPYVELRQVLDGRQVSYAPHFHNEWSIGAILDGQSEFVCADCLYNVECGALVIMNPNIVHACNPKQDSPWAYYMMHIDKDWLTTLLLRAGVRSDADWQDTHIDTLVEADFYEPFVDMCKCLMSAAYSSEHKVQILQDYLVNLFTHLDESGEVPKTPLPLNNLYQVANHLNQNCFEDTPIPIIGVEFGLSASHLIRSFKRHFNMTPHAYRLNCRVQHSQQKLKSGQSISKVAHDAGFSDQAHFQRVFKQRVAATPNQYRRSVSE